MVLVPGGRIPTAHNGLAAFMQITFQLPEDIARHLGASHPDLSRAALEAIALEGARSGELSTARIRRLLGFDTRTEVDVFLKVHAVYVPITDADIGRDAETSRDFRQQLSLQPGPWTS